MAIIHVTMKDPDSSYDAIQDHVKEELKNSGLPEDEQEALKELREEKYGEALSKFFEYGEYITIEFDTEAGTARVVTSEELEKARRS